MSEAVPTPTPTLPAPAPGHPDWPIWQCRLRPAQDGAPEAWTVGDKYLLNCEGSSSVGWTKGNVKVEFPLEEQAYTLHVLEVKKLTGHEAELLVTAYKPGDHQPEWIEISSNDAGFRTQGLTWQVQSVITPNTQPKPYTDVKLLGLSYPPWMWGLLAGILIALLLGIFIRIRQKSKIRSLVAQVDERGGSSDHFGSFHKDLRGLVRLFDYQTSRDEAVLHGYLQGLDRSLRVYFTRIFKIPFLVWGPSRLARFVKSTQRGAYKELANEIKNVLIEIKTSLESKKLSPEDIQQFKKVTTNLVGKVHAVARQREKKT